MKPDKLDEIAANVKNVSAGDPEQVKQILQALKEVFPAEADRIDAGVLVSTDAALTLAEHVLPGWEIDLRNASAGLGGNWNCAMREGTARDDDQLIGIGKAQTIPLAVVCALLQVAARRARGFY